MTIMNEKVWLAFLSSPSLIQGRTDVQVKQYVGVFWGTYDDVRQYLSERYERSAPNIVLKDLNTEMKRIQIPLGIEATPIEALGLSVRASNGLKRAHMLYLIDILGKTAEDFRRCRNVGKLLADEIVLKRDEYLQSHEFPTELQNNSEKE